MKDVSYVRPRFVGLTDDQLAFDISRSDYFSDAVPNNDVEVLNPQERDKHFRMYSELIRRRGLPSAISLILAQ